jgi:hypothetical protein
MDFIRSVPELVQAREREAAAGSSLTVKPEDEAQAPPAWPRIAAFSKKPVPNKLLSTYSRNLHGLEHR